MLKFELSIPKDRSFKILCFGAHCDDIEIGCGATMLKLTEKQTTSVHWVVFSSTLQRAQEAYESANTFLVKAQTKEVVVKKFRECFFPYVGEAIKEYFEQIKAELSPDLIFTHYRNDLHQDHRIISELTWNAFRDHLILEYEVPKYDGDFGSPNAFFHLDETICQRKIETILRCYESQKGRNWFTADTFQSLMRLRGIECNSSGRYAEAFYCRKVVLG